jgi:hypothetical protein
LTRQNHKAIEELHEVKKTLRQKYHSGGGIKEYMKKLPSVDNLYKGIKNLNNKRKSSAESKLGK